MSDSDSPRPRPRSLLRRIGSGLWGSVTFVQRVLMQLLFLLLLVAGVALGVSAWKAGKPPEIREKSVLVLDLKGPLREQGMGSSRESLLGAVQGSSRDETRLRDVLAALEQAQGDARIAAVRLRLDDFGGAGLSSLREVAAALERFKASGKPVIAWGESFDQRAYFLAAHASQLWLHPMGTVMVEGFGRQRNYYKEALDKLGVQANVLRVGRYKNAGEPYFASGPSRETLESEAHVYDAMWRLYTRAVEKARGLPDGALIQNIDSLPDSLEALGGDQAQWALKQKWVDALKTQDEFEAAMVKDYPDEAQEGKPRWRRIALSTYLQTVPKAAEGSGVAVVVAEGEIGDGEAPSGRIGGRSTSELIRKVRENERHKALVLRVNSPGGSAFASEQIRRELELMREAGKPVVISMGDVAASGGYWIAMAADEIIADEATITGSIGVFGMLPTAQGLMDKVGVHTGGHRTTWLAGAYDIRRDLDPRYARLVQAGIGRVYTDFTTKAAAARGTTREAIDAVAQGRIWTGAQALGHGLIDRNGSLADAVRTARERAKLEESAPVRYVEKDVPRVVQFLRHAGLEGAIEWGWVTKGLATVMESAVGVDGSGVGAGLGAGLGVGLSVGRIAAREMPELTWLVEVMEQRQPFAAVVHCLCSATP